MANDTATLKGKLDTQLNDTGDATWTSAEKTDLINWSIANLYPKILRPLLPASFTITLVTLTYRYTLNSGILLLSALEWVDTASNERGDLDGSLWRTEGDLMLGTGKVHVAPTIVEQLGTLRCAGYGRYDGTTNLIPDDYIPLVLATARAEAYDRVLARRERFKQWQVSNQTQNVSVNELAQISNQANQERDRLRAINRVWRRPVQARI